MSWREFHAQIIADKTVPLTNKRILLVFVMTIFFPGGFFLTMALFPKIYEVMPWIILITFIPLLIFAAYKDRSKKENVIGSFSWVGNKITIRKNADKSGEIEFAMDEISYLNFYPETRSRGSAMGVMMSGKCTVRCDLCVAKAHQRFYFIAEEHQGIYLGEICSEWIRAGYKVNMIPE